MGRTHMNDRIIDLNTGGYGSSLSADRQRVLRNTYALLALSLIPTVLGAWIGVSTGILAAMGNGASMILFFVGAFGLMFLVEKTKNSAAGVASLLAFTFFMGLMLSRRPSAAVLALAGAITAEVAAALSRRCSHSRWPPSSTMAMVTAQLFLSASASAAAAMRLTSSRVRKGFCFICGLVGIIEGKAITLTKP